MSVTVANVRSRISDRPQIWPPTAQPPELIGIGDGAATIFALRFENYIPGTLTVYAATPLKNSSSRWLAASSVC